MEALALQRNLGFGLFAFGLIGMLVIWRRGRTV